MTSTCGQSGPEDSRPPTQSGPPAPQEPRLVCPRAPWLTGLARTRSSRAPPPARRLRPCGSPRTRPGAARPRSPLPGSAALGVPIPGGAERARASGVPAAARTPRPLGATTACCFPLTSLCRLLLVAVAGVGNSASVCPELPQSRPASSRRAGARRLRDSICGGVPHSLNTCGNHQPHIRAVSHR